MIYLLPEILWTAIFNDSIDNVFLIDNQLGRDLEREWIFPVSSALFIGSVHLRALSPPPASYVSVTVPGLNLFRLPSPTLATYRLA